MANDPHTDRLIARATTDDPWIVTDELVDFISAQGLRRSPVLAEAICALLAVPGRVADTMQEDGDTKRAGEILTAAAKAVAAILDCGAAVLVPVREFKLSDPHGNRGHQYRPVVGSSRVLGEIWYVGFHSDPAVELHLPGDDGEMEIRGTYDDKASAIEAAGWSVES